MSSKSLIKLLFHFYLNQQPQKGIYQAIFEQNEILGDDPVLVDLLRDDFSVAYKRGKLLNKYTDLKITQVRGRGMCGERCRHERR